MTKALSLLLAIAVALAAAPALAKTSKHSKHQKKTHVAHVTRQSAPVHRGTATFPAGPLYYNDGTYLGDDPDPFIRSQIWRDIGARFGGPD